VAILAGAAKTGRVGIAIPFRLDGGVDLSFALTAPFTFSNQLKKKAQIMATAKHRNEKHDPKKPPMTRQRSAGTPRRLKSRRKSPTMISSRLERTSEEGRGC